MIITACFTLLRWWLFASKWDSPAFIALCHSVFFDAAAGSRVQKSKISHLHVEPHRCVHTDLPLSLNHFPELKRSVVHTLGDPGCTAKPHVPQGFYRLALQKSLFSTVMFLVNYVNEISYKTRDKRKALDQGFLKNRDQGMFWTCYFKAGK